MNDNEKIKQVFNSQNHAENYDEKAAESNWAGPEIVFGLSYACVKPGENLLDLGIGTGLSSVLFHKAGIHVYGMDGSESMLKICAGKQIAEDLKQHDLLVTPYPYADHSMDHVVSMGVFHMFDELSFIFMEVNRILKSGGFFAFCVMDYGGKEDRKVMVRDKAILDKSLAIYRYNEAEIQVLLTCHGFQWIKTVGFLGMHANQETRFKAYMAQKR